MVFDLVVLTAAVATTEGDILCGGGDEYDDVPLVSLVLFGLLEDATPPWGGCVCSADGGSGGGWYEDEGRGGGGWYEDKDNGGSGWYKDAARAVAAERDDAGVATV